MKLINTIEISPFDYSKNDYPYPKGPSLEMPEAWDTFWRQCLADSDLDILKPVQLGCFLVDFTTLSDRELTIILENELKEVDFENYEEEIFPLDGGIVVKVNHQVIIHPSCCGDLGNLMEWESILDSELDTWKQLWIGHPWLLYRRVNGCVEISDYTESNLQDIERIEAKHRFSDYEIITGIETMKKQQINFGQRITSVLSKLGVKKAEDISALLIGGK